MRKTGRLGLGVLLAVALLTAGILPDDRALLDATKRGDVVAVKAALKQGADVNAAQGDGLTALHLAAQEGNLEIVKVLLGAKANVNAKSKIGEYTPLHLAASGAHLDVTLALLAAKADPGAVTTTTGVTPLHLAAKALNGEAVVKALLEKGAPANAKETSSGQTALMFAAAYGRAAAVKELLAHGADPAITTAAVDQVQQVALERAAQARLKATLDDIRKTQPTDETVHFDSNGNRSLSPTEEQKAIAAQRALLESADDRAKALSTPVEPADAPLPAGAPAGNTGGGRGAAGFGNRAGVTETLVGKTGGMSALHHAAREGQIEAAVALIDGGANINQRSADGSTPLVQALLNGRYDLALVLIQKGADVNLATETDGIAPLFALLQTQWTLKFTDHPQPRAQDNQKAGYMEVLNALLDKGANPNARLKTHLWFLEWEGKFGMDFTGATPFWRATFAQDLDAMKALAAHGADPNIPTAWPENSMRGGRQEDGRLQEDSGLPKMPKGTPNLYPIQAAAGGGFLGLGAFQQNNVPNNFLPSVKFLVEEMGADVNLPDAWGYTPLHYAAVRGDNALIEYLVAKGADPKAISRLGQSVVDMTRGGRNGFFSRTPHPQTMELLLRLGSEFKCLNTHFRNNGDWCPGAGVPPFKGAVQQDGQVTTTK